MVVFLNGNIHFPKNINNKKNNSKNSNNEVKMSIKIDIEMPKSCLSCPLFIHGEGNEMNGVLESTCRILPIRDLDGKVICYQKVFKTKEDFMAKKRNKHCPLKEI